MSDSDSAHVTIPQSGEFEVLRFRIDGTEFLTPLELTENIVEWQEPSLIPRTGDGVHGVTDLRGEITVLLNARPFLHTEEADGNIEEVAADRDEQLILMFSEDVDEQRMGVSIDDIIRTETYDAEQVSTTTVLSAQQSPGIESGVLSAIVVEDYDTDSEDAQSEQDDDSEEPDVESLDEDSVVGVIDPGNLIDVATEPVDSQVR